MDYVFYFDETYHDRKIAFTSNGDINTLQEDKSDSYIGVFWGCKQSQLKKNIMLIGLTQLNPRYRQRQVKVRITVQ